MLWTLIQSLSLRTLSKSFSTADREPVGYEYSMILSININNITDKTTKIVTNKCHNLSLTLFNNKVTFKIRFKTLL